MVVTPPPPPSSRSIGARWPIAGVITITKDFFRRKDDRFLVSVFPADKSTASRRYASARQSAARSFAQLLMESHSALMHAEAARQKPHQCCRATSRSRCPPRRAAHDSLGDRWLVNSRQRLRRWWSSNDRHAHVNLPPSNAIHENQRMKIKLIRN